MRPEACHGSAASFGPAAGASIILCADDYAISQGVSRGILELAHRRRISATSAIVSLDRWPQDAPALAEARGHIAVGLHVNLTLGRPLGPMPSLADRGHLPKLRSLVLRALARRIDVAEVAAEVERQIDRFMRVLGFPPDHVDGHQHVHTLPWVREGFLTALKTRFPVGGPLVRNPVASRTGSLTFAAQAKGLMIAALSRGFAESCRASGFHMNSGFAGVSSFSRKLPYAAELTTALRAASGLHLVMCHPGHADAELSRLDPMVMRREDELRALMAIEDLPHMIWHPQRSATGPAVDWGKS
jgi:predicted glycoside hydrolase/deacetylase ChbG (UPF0249 family)